MKRKFWNILCCVDNVASNITTLGCLCWEFQGLSKRGTGHVWLLQHIKQFQFTACCQHPLIFLNVGILGILIFDLNLIKMEKRLILFTLVLIGTNEILCWRSIFVSSIISWALIMTNWFEVVYLWCSCLVGISLLQRVMILNGFLPFYLQDALMVLICLN